MAQHHVIEVKGARLSWGDWLFVFVIVHYMWWFVCACALGVGAFAWLGSRAGGLIALVAAVAYAPSFLTPVERRGGRPWNAFRRHRIWRACHRYFETGARFTRIGPPLDPNKQYLFGWHPHGILIVSRILSYGGVLEELLGLPGLDFRVLAASPLFWLPGCRDICLWMGAVDASKRNARRVLADGTTVFVYPGGSKEIFSTDPNSAATELVLKHRKGFVKLALERGTSLVPVFVFGEKWMYSRLNIARRARDWCLRTLRIPLLFFWGRGGLTQLPHRPLLNPRATFGLVVGEPIDVPAPEGNDGAITQEAIDALHAKYVAAVRALFEEHKAAHGYGPDETLVIT